MENLFKRPREVPVDDDHLAAMRKDAKRRLCPYKAPEWAEKLKRKPSSKINLCQKNTPIHRWYLPDIPEDFKIYIKRDDMSGSTLGGHKIRKLEFQLADALEKNCKTLIGIGSAESNSCRTLAVAGKELGFHVHLVQYTEKDTFPLNCNIFLSQMAGAHIHLIQVDDVIKAMKEAKIPDDLRGKEHQPTYILPVYPGGDGEDGIYGYIDAFQELVSQELTKNFTDIILTNGSSLTTVAFIIGNYMTGSKLRLHTLSIRCSKEECKGRITNLLKNYGFLDIMNSHVDFEDLISVVEDSREPKYGQFYDEHVDFVRMTATSTGVFLDPIYTGKTANHMVKMIRTSPNSFKGKKILFYNTGSVFGSLNEDMLHRMKSDNALNTENHVPKTHKAV